MVQGISDLNKRVAQIPKRIELAARGAMEKGADELVAMMKRLVPKDTGDLRDSIGWTWGNAPAGSKVIAQSDPNERGLRITVYAGSQKAFYAAWVEFGTAPHNVAKAAATRASAATQQAILVRTRNRSFSHHTGRCESAFRTASSGRHAPP